MQPAWFAGLWGGTSLLATTCEEICLESNFASGATSAGSGQAPDGNTPRQNHPKTNLKADYSRQITQGWQLQGWNKGET
jgi:hypothetical protein